MYIEARAGQRETGQHEAAGSVLQTAFVTQAVKSLEKKQQEFEMLAGIVRKFSDNFVPETFRARNNGNLPEGCLAQLMKGNIQSFDKLEQCWASFHENGLLSPEKYREYADLYDEESERLQKAQIFYADWERLHPASSQREHNAV